MKNEYEDYNDGYYHIAKDVEDYPDAWCYVVWSKRGPGKTYGCLWHSYWKGFPIMYMKRTIDDVKLICDKPSDDSMDKSPFKDINRDKGCNVRAKLIEKGIGGFYDCDEDGDAVGAPVSYIAALNAIKSIKGFGLSECEWLVLDEFIPQAGEIVRHAEGDMLLNLYMTLSRDREKRGRGHLKLILFANAEEISTPITSTLEIIDDMAELNASRKSHLYIEDRGILLHHITNEEIPLQASERTGIYKAMSNTAWGRIAFEGDFANNDFSNIVTLPIKHMKPFIKLHYKTHDYYIYIRESDGMYYMTDSPAECRIEYDLNTENDQKRFWLERGIDLRLVCMDNRFKFRKYSMYDLIINYRKYFDNI